MSVPQCRFPGSQFVEGVQIPVMGPVNNFQSAVHYKAQDDDVFIVTYPKCGTTWVQHIVVLLFAKGEPVPPNKIHAVAPFIDMMGAKAAEDKPKPGAVKTHLPYRVIPWSEKAKYIYVARNPKDCCVSYFHHNKNMGSSSFPGDFNEFFEFFIAGDVHYGDYFDHLIQWYEHRNDPNVLFITYEELKEDPEDIILKIASFMGDQQYADPLRQDPNKLKNVIRYSSFEYMKEVVNKNLSDLFSMSKEEILNSDLSDEMKKSFSRIAGLRKGEAKSNPLNFVRKGVVGDWKNYFSEDQSRRMDEKFAERTKGTDLANRWGKYM